MAGAVSLSLLGCGVQEEVVRVDDPPDAGAMVDVPGSDLGPRPVDVQTAQDQGPFDAGSVPMVDDRPGVPRVDDRPAVPPNDVGSPAMDAGSVPADVGCVLAAPVARPPAGLPSRLAVVEAAAAAHPEWLAGSCAERGGSLRFLFEVVQRLRQGDGRWGLDRRDGALRGDIVTYFYGDGCPEGSDQVYAVDVIARRCAVPGVDDPSAPSWLDVTGGGARWSLQGYDPTGPGPMPVDAGPAPVDTGPPPVTMLPLPDQRGLSEAVGSSHAEALGRSCGNNDWLFELTRQLRRTDRRWGLNWKRGVVGDMSQDVVNYYYGPGEPREGATEVYIIDVIVGHCGDDPRPGWLDQTEPTRAAGTIGRWTLAGRNDLGP